MSSLERRHPFRRALTMCILGGVLFASSLNASALAIGMSPVKTPARPSTQRVTESEYFKLHQASHYIQDGQEARALPYLIEALEQNPGNLLALFHQGNIYLELAKNGGIPQQNAVFLEQAQQAFERVLDINSQLSITYFKLGKIALLRGDNAEAKRLYEAGLKEDPANAALMFNLARVYDSTQETAKAIELYQKTIKTDPGFIFAYNNLGLLYEETKDYKSAEKTYRQALRKNDVYNLPRLNLGNLYASTGRYEEAEATLNEAMRREPENAWGHYYLGNLHMRREQFEQATACYEKAARLNPEYPTTFYLLAVSLSKQKRMDEALQASLNYIKLAPQGEYSKEMNSLIVGMKMLKAGGLYFVEAGKPSSK